MNILRVSYYYFIAMVKAGKHFGEGVIMLIISIIDEYLYLRL